MIRSISFLAATLILASCVSPRTSTPDIRVPDAVVRGSVRFHKEYVLAPGDQVEVIVRRAPEASRTVTIRPDGYLTLPLVKDVAAANLTIPELDKKLTELFSARLLDPDVTVIATQVRQPMVYVMGDVNNNAAAVPLRDAPTALQAVTFAGGLRRSASPGDITIVRLGDDGFLRAIRIEATVGGQPGPLIALRTSLLQPDDIVFVPENGRSQVARFLDDFVTRPLIGINGIVGTYVNFRLVRDLP